MREFATIMPNVVSKIQYLLNKIDHEPTLFDLYTICWAALKPERCSSCFKKGTLPEMKNSRLRIRYMLIYFICFMVSELHFLIQIIQDESHRK